MDVYGRKAGRMNANRHDRKVERRHFWNPPVCLACRPAQLLHFAKVLPLSFQRGRGASFGGAVPRKLAAFICGLVQPDGLYRSDKENHIWRLTFGSMTEPHALPRPARA